MNQVIELPNTTARNAAVNALVRFEVKQLRIQDSLDMIFKSSSLDTRDKKFATELAYGCCRSLITLDYLINSVSKRPVKRIDPIIACVLRTAVYQMFFLKGSPDFAVVNEAVEQIFQAAGRGACGFGNAVLRGIQSKADKTVSSGDCGLSAKIMWTSAKEGRQFRGAIFPDPKRQLAKHLGAVYGHPMWLVERWLKLYSPEMVRQLCIANNGRPPLTLRANTLKISRDGLQKKLAEAKISALAYENAVQLQGHYNVSQLPGFQEGLFSVQDYTAMQAASLLGVRPGERVLDLCAAPGGKTTHLAELMNNEGEIVACDVNTDKLELIRENCRRLGISIVKTILADNVAGLTQNEPYFDAILLDVPCSNTGVMARRVELRHLLTAAGLENLAKQQLRLLEQAAGWLKPEGRLVYSTCSIDPTENERVIERFVRSFGRFRVVSQRPCWPYYPPESLETGRPGRSSKTARRSAELDGLQEPLAVAHDGGFVSLLHSE